MNRLIRVKICRDYLGPDTFVDGYEVNEYFATAKNPDVIVGGFVLVHRPTGLFTRYGKPHTRRDVAAQGIAATRKFRQRTLALTNVHTAEAAFLKEGSAQWSKTWWKRRRALNSTRMGA